MIDNYSIRQAESADYPKIRSLIFDIWINEYSFIVTLEDYPDLQHIQKYYQDRAGKFFVFLVKERIVGTISCDKLDDKIYVLKRMFVDKMFRRQGVAQKLLDKVFEEAKPGCRFYLSTKKDQAAAAKKIYLKNGFDIIEKSILPSGFPFFYEDDLFMMKSVLVKHK